MIGSEVRVCICIYTYIHIYIHIYIYRESTWSAVQAVTLSSHRAMIGSGGRVSSGRTEESSSEHRTHT